MSVRKVFALLACAVLAGVPLAGSAQAHMRRAAAAAQPASPVCAECVKADMQRLAGDDLRGRKCGTDDEAFAASYIAGRLRAAGVEPAYGRRFIQPVKLVTPVLSTAPVLDVTVGGVGLRWRHGREFVLVGGQARPAEGKLVRLTPADLPAREWEAKGAIVFYDPTDPEAPAGAVLKRLYAAGAKAVLLPAGKTTLARWTRLAELPKQETDVQGAPADPCPDCVGQRVYLGADAAAALRAGKLGPNALLRVGFTAPLKRTTRNVVGVLHGTAPDADRNAILLSAHYDHLGVRDGVIFHGADDDASGTTAVMEFARVLGKGERPKRTIYFALFGCEEEGGFGATYFRSHPPTALADLALNLEFEMIGLRDPKTPKTLMLTGWERSDLGPALAAAGARIGPDNYPEQKFFQRSDNYQLALQGVVAQTVSGWPVPPSYHRADDDLKHVDLAFMAETIGSLAGPIRKLADGDFRPSWKEGGRPTRTAAP